MRPRGAACKRRSPPARCLQGDAPAPRRVKLHQHGLRAAVDEVGEAREDPGGAGGGSGGESGSCLRQGSPAGSGAAWEACIAHRQSTRPTHFFCAALMATGVTACRRRGSVGACRSSGVPRRPGRCCRSRAVPAPRGSSARATTSDMAGLQAARGERCCRVCTDPLLRERHSPGTRWVFWVDGEQADMRGATRLALSLHERGAPADVCLELPLASPALFLYLTTLPTTHTAPWPPQAPPCAPASSAALPPRAWPPPAWAAPTPPRRCARPPTAC